MHAAHGNGGSRKQRNDAEKHGILLVKASEPLRTCEELHRPSGPEGVQRCDR